MNGEPHKYETIAKDLRDGIAGGTYPRGTMLPSRGQLEKKYGVSAITARAAVKLLAEEGLVSMRQGSGTIVIGEREQPEEISLERELVTLFGDVKKCMEIAVRDGYLHPRTADVLPLQMARVIAAVAVTWDRRQ